MQREKARGLVARASSSADGWASASPRSEKKVNSVGSETPEIASASRDEAGARLADRIVVDEDDA